jgi:hypothetical protein
MIKRIVKNELGQTITEYWCERCLGWHDLNEDPEPIWRGPR